MREMMAGSNMWLASKCALVLMAAAVPWTASAQDDIRDGVNAWSAGEYETAVNLWSVPASAGDPDALFNLGQAYRLGRGVTRDLERAQELYRQAASAGHIRAADTYGLMLFQAGRHEQAMPYVIPAAGRGDPRAQYLLGVAHFNGQLVERDWEKAYALLTLANGAGLPQAASAIARMDQHIPLAVRQSAVELAMRLKVEAEQASAVQFAAADLGVSEATGPVPANAVARIAGQVAARPLETASIAPSAVAANAALQEARMANGTADPANAGASYAQSDQASRPPVQIVAATPAPPAPRRIAAPPPAPPPPAPVATPTQRYGGEWQVQLGAFGVLANAENLWSRLSARPELRGATKLLIPTGRVTRLLAGGYATRADAQNACNALKAAGQDCLVTR